MKLVIISGGSRGLGAALFAEFSTKQFTLVEFSRSAPHSYSVPCDFSDPTQVQTVVAKALQPLISQAWEEIVVINNAGTLFPMGATQQKETADILKNIQVNFSSSIVFITEALKAFQAHPCKKTVVNISSGAAAKGYAGWSLYCAAKAGLENFIRAIAIEQQLQKSPFTAINIVPGIIDTQMQESIRAASLTDFPTRARFEQFKESGALSSPQKVASAVLKILASNPQSGERFDVANFF